jgi:TPR repeat protein
MHEGVRWYRKSAGQGYPKTHYNLGYMYYYGYGAPRYADLVGLHC